MSNETFPRSEKFIFVSYYGFWMKFHQKTWKIDFWPNFETLDLREYFTEFRETASPNILGVEGPHNVAKNIGNTFYKIYSQQWKQFPKNLWKEKITAEGFYCVFYELKQQNMFFIQYRNWLSIMISNNSK